MTLQDRMDAAVDTVLDLLDEAAREGVGLDPLATIMQRLKARGDELDLSQAPPLLQIILGGMT